MRLCHVLSPSSTPDDGDRNKLRASECQWSVLHDFSLPKVQQHLFLEMRPLRTILNTVTPSHPFSACSSSSLLISAFISILLKLREAQCEQRSAKKWEAVSLAEKRKRKEDPGGFWL